LPDALAHFFEGSCRHRPFRFVLVRPEAIAREIAPPQTWATAVLNSLTYSSSFA
jgi:hypothetical protein